MPISVFLGLSVLDLGPMYATDRRQTDRQTDVRQHHRLMPSPNRDGGIIIIISPDGLSLVTWQNGKALCWVVTVICSLADSYISAAARDAGAAAELAASRKEVKYAGLDVDICLLPLPSRTWEYQALQLASSFHTLVED